MDFSTLFAAIASINYQDAAAKVALATFLLTALFIAWTSVTVQRLIIFTCKCLVIAYKYAILAYLAITTAFVLYLDAIFVSLLGKGVFCLHPGRFQMDLCSSDVYGLAMMLALTALFSTLSWLAFKWVKGDVK